MEITKKVDITIKCDGKLCILNCFYKNNWDIYCDLFGRYIIDDERCKKCIEIFGNTRRTKQ